MGPWSGDPEGEREGRREVGRQANTWGNHARGGPCPVSRKTTRRPQCRGAGLVGKEDRKWLAPSGVLEDKGASGFGSDLDFTLS